jgi:hypothetical protein
MTRLEKDIEQLKERFGERLVVTPLPSGSRLIEIRDYRLVPGWNKDLVTILFLAPPAFPAAKPDCFWVEPGPIRYAGNQTPQNTNDSNPIPEVGPRGTWFSWHLQEWDPNRHSLMNFVRVIEQRLNPPR